MLVLKLISWRTKGFSTWGFSHPIPNYCSTGWNSPFWTIILKFSGASGPLRGIRGALQQSRLRYLPEAEDLGRFHGKASSCLWVGRQGQGGLLAAFGLEYQNKVQLYKWCILRWKRSRCPSMRYLKEENVLDPARVFSCANNNAVAWVYLGLSTPEGNSMMWLSHPSTMPCFIVTGSPFLLQKHPP